MKVWRVANSFEVPETAEGERCALRMPYGDYPAGRMEIKKGESREVIQRLNRDGALAVANALEGEKRLGAPGIPVYAGHPDVPELAAKYPDKAAKGWIVAVVANEHDAELVVEWNGPRPRKREFAFFSPYFFGEVSADDGSTAIMHINDIGSVGLTNTPRIHAFRVPNEQNLESNPKGQEMNEELKQKLLAALGLPTDSDDEAILAAVQTAAKAVEELAGARAKAEAAEADKNAAEKAKEETAVALANERSARISLLLDGAISEARITPAEKPRWEKLLGENFEANRLALANEAPKLKTKAAASAAAAVATAKGAANVDLIAIANEKMKKNPGLTYTAAFAQAMKEHPEVK